MFELFINLFMLFVIAAFTFGPWLFIKANLGKKLNQLINESEADSKELRQAVKANKPLSQITDLLRKAHDSQVKLTAHLLKGIKTRRSFMAKSKYLSLAAIFVAVAACVVYLIPNFGWVTMADVSFFGFAAMFASLMASSIQKEALEGVAKVDRLRILCFDHKDMDEFSPLDDNENMPKLIELLSKESATVDDVSFFPIAKLDPHRALCLDHVRIAYKAVQEAEAQNQNQDNAKGQVVRLNLNEEITPEKLAAMGVPEEIQQEIIEEVEELRREQEQETPDKLH